MSNSGVCEIYNLYTKIVDISYRYGKFSWSKLILTEINYSKLVFERFQNSSKPFWAFFKTILELIAAYLRL